MTQVLLSAAQSLWVATQILFLSAVLFGSLAVLLKGDEAFAAARRAVVELRINLGLSAFDALLIGPAIGVLVQVLRRIVSGQGLMVISAERWSSIGTVGTVVAVAFIGDFGSYWRHRFEHTRWLWPAHAVHHSDTDM